MLPWLSDVVGEHLTYLSLYRSTAPASAILQELFAATAKSARAAAGSSLASFVQKEGLRSLAVHGILDELVKASKSKDPLAREGAMVAYEELFRKVGLAGGADPYFVPLLPSILDLFQESGKTSSIKDAAEKAAKQLVRLSPPELAPKVIEELFSVIDGGAKWRSKVGALELLQTFATSAKDQVAERLGEYVPRLSGAMRDTKAEVRTFLLAFVRIKRLTLLHCTLLYRLLRPPRRLVLLFAMSSPTPTSSLSCPTSSNAWPTLPPSPPPSSVSRPPSGFARLMALPLPSSLPSSPVPSASVEPSSSARL